MHPMWGQWGWGGGFLVYGLLWIVVVVVGLMSLWRGMQAQERMARHLEGIERALSQRSPS